LAATTLRNQLGTKTLQEVLQDRESLAQHMQVNIIELNRFDQQNILIILFLRKYWMKQLMFGNLNFKILNFLHLKK
jgi:hypothetical protein